MNERQHTTLNCLIVDQALVLDRVYFDHKTGDVNFRAYFTWNSNAQKPSYSGEGIQHRLKIDDTGKVLNRV